MSSLNLLKKVIFANLVTYEVLHGQRQYSLSLSSWPLSGFWHHWSQHLNHNNSVNLHGSVLEWFKSFYLSDRCFRVKCENSFSSSHTCSCGVPQGSVLGPLLFVLYATPLSTLISSLSLNHQFCADDTQLFSFYPSDLESSITHLQNAFATDLFSPQTIKFFRIGNPHHHLMVISI